MTDVVCISPIDGSEVARRASASAAAIDVALTAARQAQKQWAKVPLTTRMAKMTAFVDAMLAMNQEVVPEIARQMGRPVKWGGEFRPFEERARHMIAIAPEALKPHVPKPIEGFTRFIDKTPAGVVLVIAVITAKAEGRQIMK